MVSWLSSGYLASIAAEAIGADTSTRLCLLAGNSPVVFARDVGSSAIVRFLATVAAVALRAGTDALPYCSGNIATVQTGDVRISAFRASDRFRNLPSTMIDFAFA